MMRATRQEFLVASGLEEDGILAGNFYDKYGSRNPIVKFLMSGFAHGLESLVAQSGAQNIHEVGCGEGHWSLTWAARGLKVRGSDFSSQVIDLAERNAQAQKVTASFRVASIYDLTPPVDAAELVVCCEVLEHLEEPQRAVKVLESIASPWLVASVPREPIWSFMNMARGKYWSDMGNTPGHIQRWSSSAFLELLKPSFEIVKVVQPVPWTMALCRRRGA